MRERIGNVVRGQRHGLCGRGSAWGGDGEHVEAPQSLYASAGLWARRALQNR